MPTKSEKHIRAAQTRKANKVDRFIPSQPIQLPKDAGTTPHQDKSMIRHGMVTLHLMRGLQSYHSVKELREWLAISTGSIVEEKVIRFWLKLAVTLGLVNVYVQPLQRGHRFVYILEGQSVDQKYRPYLSLEECNQRFTDEYGEGHPERKWW